MIQHMKIRLKPTKEQESLFIKSCGAKRFAYNWGLERFIEIKKNGEIYNKYKLKKEFNQYKKQFDWIKEVSSDVTAMAFTNLDIAINNYFNKITKYPKFKSKKHSKQSFYVRYDRLYFKNGKVQMCKIGDVVYHSDRKIPILDTYINPVCSFDGKYWYLSFGYEVENQDYMHSNESIGVDVGVKELAIISDGTVYPNINKSVKVKRIKKRIKRKQRQLARKYEANKLDQNKYVDTKNILKLNKEIKLLNRKLTNIRFNYIHHLTSDLVKKLPQRIVIEDLIITEMTRNKHMAKLIKEQNLFEFIKQITYKCEKYGIELVKADKWFPSSKICCKCGKKNNNLKLSDRIYKCECGNVIDRDYQASLNLKRYGEMVLEQSVV